MSRYAVQFERVLALIEDAGVREHLQEDGVGYAPDSSIAALVAFADEQQPEGK